MGKLASYITKFKNTKGFTLVEVLIVLAILAIIAAAALPILTNQTAQGFKKEAYNQLEVLRGAMNTFYNTPATLNGGGGTYQLAGATPTFANISYDPNSAAGGNVPHFTYGTGLGGSPTTVAAQTWSCTATAITAAPSNAPAGTITINQGGTITGTGAYA